MFFIPLLAPKPPASKAIVVEDQRPLPFSSRQEALAYALQKCREAARRDVNDAVIRTQGTDGEWRTFDSRLMPVKEAPELFSNDQINLIINDDHAIAADVASSAHRS